MPAEQHSAVQPGQNVNQDLGQMLSLQGGVSVSAMAPQQMSADPSQQNIIGQNINPQQFPQQNLDYQKTQDISAADSQDTGTVQISQKIPVVQGQEDAAALQFGQDVVAPLAFHQFGLPPDAFIPPTNAPSTSSGLDPSSSGQQIAFPLPPEAQRPRFVFGNHMINLDPKVGPSQQGLDPTFGQPIQQAEQPLQFKGASTPHMPFPGHVARMRNTTQENLLLEAHSELQQLLSLHSDTSSSVRSSRHSLHDTESTTSTHSQHVGSVNVRYALLC